MDLGANRITNVLRGINIKLAALIVQFLFSIAFQLMGSFLPLFIETDLNYPLIDATYWASVAQLIASSILAFTAPFWGSMCDRAGIKKITIIVLVANAVVYTGMSMSTDIAHILLFRALQGSFGGGSTVMFALVAAIYVGAELKQALSYQIATMTLGSLVGPGLGGFLASIVGYRLTFLASTFLFVGIIPIIFLINIPPPSRKVSERPHFIASDFKAIIPDFISLILVYACIQFIIPIIPWFLESLGILNEQLLFYTTLTTILGGAAFAIATPLLPRIITDRNLPLVSLVASVAILMTAFVTDPTQFIALRVAVGAIQAGIPPFLLGGEGGTARKGATMGLLNSARFLGISIGPFIATSVLGGGEPSRVIGMFATMAGLSLSASIVIYLTHKGTYARASRN